MLYFIVNQTARTGKGSKVWKDIKAVLNETGTEYKAFRTVRIGHAAEMANKLSKINETMVSIVVVGGDGTINEVVNGIDDLNRVRLGIIPAGSGNDFANGVGIKGSTEECIRKLIEASEETDEYCDIGLVWWDNITIPRRFVISSGVGLDAIVCKKALTSGLKKVLNKISLGRITYLLLTIQSLFFMKTVNGNVSFDNEKGKNFHNMIFSAAMNLKAEGGGVKMAPKADKTDGKLHLCVAHGIAKAMTFFALPFLAVGKHEKFKCFYMKDFSECSIELSKKQVLHADGEYCGEVRKVSYKCVPGGLRLINNGIDIL